MVQWDVDRYEQLQQAAWELDHCAAEQDTRARSGGRASEGATNRARARAMRLRAAALLAQYWVLPRVRTP